LTKEKPVSSITAAQLAQELLGKTVYVDWPYLKEALVMMMACLAFMPFNNRIVTTCSFIVSA